MKLINLSVIYHRVFLPQQSIDHYSPIIKFKDYSELQEKTTFLLRFRKSAASSPVQVEVFLIEILLVS